MYRKKKKTKEVVQENARAKAESMLWQECWKN